MTVADHQLHQRPPASSTTTSFINDHQLHQRPPASSTTTSFINDHQLHQRPPASSTTTSFINDHQLHQRPPASSTTTSFINDQQLPATTSNDSPKPTPPPRQNSHKDVDYSGWQRHSPATNHAGTYRVSEPNGPIYYAMSYEASAQ
ncbi:hypothetical protein N7450_011730 [Penicillium hetheringtonii]|uniref:Uncharacterized protein n=1 Tax=Penicillium hetheringtonii TaxID=911720 RepID=A0AAD6DAF9_9EURO|nr:hypothetical protein N7450_011730 [Penicillium hetheringtonii]